MKLTKFRIRNYKSIKDTGYCFLSSDLTILAGKNESGKTTILEALHDFDRSIGSVSPEALPLDGSGEPLLELCFELDGQALHEVQQRVGQKLNERSKELIKAEGVTIFKDQNGEYELGDKLVSAIDEDVNRSNEYHLKKIRDSLNSLETDSRTVGVEPPKLNGSIASFITELSSFLALNWISSFTDQQKRKNIEQLADEIRAESTELKKELPSEQFTPELIERIPKFIFFSDFLDILPFEIPLSQIRDNRLIQDFAKISKLNIDEVITASSTHRRRNILSTHSAKISGDFMGYWGQSNLELVAEADGNNLRLGVKEQNGTILYRPDQRSKGFQWFLTFYLRLNAEKDKTNVILIDEPGLYLHAKAQKDVLKVLETICRDSRIVFTTHSPYLIDAEKLARLRLVINNESGTRISKIHKGADNETLTPIITAIGLDLSNDFSIVGKQNVLLEGISDYYFLRGMSAILPNKLDGLNFIPCVGATKIPQLCSLLIGWGLDFIILLDNDREGKRVAKELTDDLMVDSNRIIFISRKEGFSIEDLFTHDDFNLYILDDEKNSELGTLNSRFLRDKTIDKVLLAKTFYERAIDNDSEIRLSADTTKAFERVFNEVNSKFGTKIVEVI